MRISRSSSAGTPPPGALRSSFTPLGMWAFSIGTSIGWGSFIVTCNTYLQKSGILGTVFGLLAGMAVIFVITWNLQYMIRKAPGAGGVYTFEKQVAGKEMGFLALWFVLLTYLAILWANMTSLPLFARFFLGDTFRFGFHYEILGYEVWFGEALLSICAVALVGFLCAKSSRLPNYIMIVSALVFVLGFTVCAVLAIVNHDDTYSYSPLYTEGSSSYAQIVRIAVISPWAFIGFENVSHFSEEYRFKVKRIRGILISSVIFTTVLYLFVSLLSVSAYPPEYGSWLDYIRDMGNLQGIKAVPAFYAADHYLGQTGVTILMLALFGVILTSLIGNLLALSRLLFAAGREGEAPAKLAAVNRHGVPGKAILAVVGVSAVIPFLGRTAIGWIVDVTTLGGTLIYGLISYAVYRHAKQSKKRPEMVTGVVGLLLMGVFVLLLLIPGLLPFDAMETESYVLFIVWAVLGLAYFRVLIRKDSRSASNNRIIVWILLLVLVLFASMMWVSRATETAADNAVEQIYNYHQTHLEHDEVSEEERAAFLQEQAGKISGTNTLYSAVSLGLFLLSIGIMLNNYKETQKLGVQLDQAEKKANLDALTGVKNKHAYLDAEEQLDRRIAVHRQTEFAIVMLDINDLKVVNDTHGHPAGDQYLKDACRIICDIFKRSPVFRVGGDEFAVIVQGADYQNIEELVGRVRDHNTLASQTGGIVIACGMSRYDRDACVAPVFERADIAMYENKSLLKSGSSGPQA